MSSLGGRNAPFHYIGAMEWMPANLAATPTPRSILVVLALIILPLASHGQKNTKASKDPERAQMEQLQKDTDAAIDSGELGEAISLLSERLRIKYDQKVAALLGQLQLQAGDTSGYCRSQRYTDKSRDPNALALYTSICEERDSVTFEASGLSISRYPGIIAVTRKYDRADGRTYYELYDHEGGSELAFSTIDKDTIYSKTAQMPKFPGGDDEMFKFLGKTIRYPMIATDNRISGVVYLTFVIDKEGLIREPEIVRGVHYSIDAESVRVVSAMPIWQPGYHAGEPVEFKFNLPIRYTLR